MRVKYFLQLLAFVVITTHSYSQDTIDSVKMEKNKLAAITLRETIAKQRVKLEEMEAKYRGMEVKSDDENQQSQLDANQNSRISDRLSDDPTNKRLNRKANRAARDARSQAKQARKQTSRNKHVEKDMRKLKEQIEKNEQKLAKYSL